MNKLAIVVPTLTNKIQGYEALASVRTDACWEPFIIPNWKLNLPLSAAWNFGIQSAFNKGYESVLVINDDIVFAENTIDLLLDRFDREKPNNVLLLTPHNARGVMSVDDLISHNNSGTGELSDSPDFSCFLLDKDTIETVGWFDENFIPAYFEDNDYHHRIERAGARGCSASDILFYHYGSSTQNADPNNPVVSSPAFVANGTYYIQKWGGQPGKEIFSSPYNNPDLTFKDWKKIR